MALLIHYASIPNLLINWFPTVCADLSVPISPESISTDLPDDYKNACPFVRVTRLGGARHLGIDHALVRLEVFALSYDDAETIANELSSLIEWQLHFFSDGQARVITAENTIAPSYAPWDDQPVTRFMGTYLIVAGSLT